MTGMRICTAFLLAHLLCPVGLAAQQKGHAIRDDRIIIDSSAHWEAWKVAGGIAGIAPDGSVRPSFQSPLFQALWWQ